MRDAPWPSIAGAERAGATSGMAAGLDALVDAAPLGVIYVDRELRVIAVNAAFVALAGGARERCLERPLAAACPGGAALAVLAAAIRDTGAPRSGERWGHLIVHGYPVRVGGAVVAVGCIVQRDARGEAERRAGVAHELRAAAATILLWEELLRERPAEPGLRERALEAIRQTAVAQLRHLDAWTDHLAARREPPRAAAPSLRGLCVLVVDDDRDMREALALLLGAAGAVVETASTVEAAWDAIARGAPDVLVSDVAIAGDDDGHGLLRRVRAHAGARGLYAVAHTARASAGDRDRALAAGFDVHVAKPIDIDELAAILAWARPALR